MRRHLDPHQQKCQSPGTAGGHLYPQQTLRNPGTAWKTMVAVDSLESAPQLLDITVCLTGTGHLRGNLYTLNPILQLLGILTQPQHTVVCLSGLALPCQQLGSLLQPLHMAECSLETGQHWKVTCIPGHDPGMNASQAVTGFLCWVSYAAWPVPAAVFAARQLAACPQSRLPYDLSRAVWHCPALPCQRLATQTPGMAGCSVGIGLLSCDLMDPCDCCLHVLVLCAVLKLPCGASCLALTPAVVEAFVEQLASCLQSGHLCRPLKAVL